MSAVRDPRTVEHPPIDAETWRAKVESELKGAPFDEALRRRTPEGITLEPLYTPDSAPAPDRGFPGLGQLVRGSTPLSTHGGWRNAARYDHPDPQVVGAQLAGDLARGATGAWLVIARPGGGARSGGVAIDSAAALALALGDVPLAGLHVILDAGGYALPAASLLLAQADERGIARADLDVDFAADPLGQLATSGALPGSLDDALAQAAELARLCATELPGARAAVASAVPYHEAGGHAIDELGYGLATALAYLRAFEAAGMSLDEAAGQITLRFPIGRNVFGEIAKLRAARLVWAKLLAACEVDGVAPRIHAVASPRTMTRRDPWVNMLRGTTQSFAAICGGADVVTTTAFDAALGQPEELGRRIARNTQIVLGEESRLGQVIDPAGGSWYMEALTDELARGGWRRLQEIEGAGGVAGCLTGGAAANEMAARWTELSDRIGRRKVPVTGVSEYANTDEVLPKPPTARDAAGRHRTEPRGNEPAELAALAEAEPDTRVPAATAAAAAGATLAELASSASRGDASRATPLARHREAEPFESLRDAADAAPERPRVFLANLGRIPQHKARATFAANFFAAGGITAEGPDGTGAAKQVLEGDAPSAPPAEAAAELARAFASSGARVACICGTDDQYQSMAAEVAGALRDAGAEVIYLAGKPSEHEGVSRYIYMGCDVRGELAWLLAELGVMR